MTLASRRGFLPSASCASLRSSPPATEPFHGPHQGGIATRQQAHTYFATFDLSAETRDEVRTMLQNWTDAASKLCAGATAEGAESHESPEMPASHLTITFGFGPGLFSKDGKDRYGLAARRPAALVDLPIFSGDQLQPGRCGGDLSVQACADDPRIAVHVVRLLARLAYGKAQLRWAQSGFVPSLVSQASRNRMGFRDDGNTLDAPSQADISDVVWVGDEGPDWMRGGTYVVPRRIRIALEQWTSTPQDLQRLTLGRRVSAGTTTIRLASVSGGSARILRRGYSYNDGPSFTAERWPPRRQSMEYESGLLFVGYQKDPRTGFIKMFERMAKFDMMNQLVTHIGSGIFACPPGCAQGESLGARLLG